LRFPRLVTLAVAVSVVACSQPAQPPDRSVNNPVLRVRLTTLPEGLRVAENQGSTLELRPADETVGGVIRFAVGPEQEGINLVAAVQDHQARIAGLVDGDYKGAQELQTPFGAAFYSRGRYLDDGIPQEETALLMIHPTESQLLTITYRYPAGDDSAARVEQLIGVLAEIE
jgi:hypothetical protein